MAVLAFLTLLCVYIAWRKCRKTARATLVTLLVLVGPPSAIWLRDHLVPLDIQGREILGPPHGAHVVRLERDDWTGIGGDVWVTLPRSRRPIEWINMIGEKTDSGGVAAIWLDDHAGVYHFRISEIG